MSRPSRGRWHTLVLVVLLAAWQLWLLHGFRDHLDLHPCDGVVYLKNGLAMGRGQLHAPWLAWGPMQGLAYAGLHALGVPLTAAQDVLAVLVAMGSTVALFACLAALIGVRFAWPLAALWAASASVLHDGAAMMPPPTYLLSAALCWAGYAAALRGRIAGAVVAFVLAVLERGELGAGLVVGAFVLAWFARGALRWRAVAVALVVMALVAVQQRDPAVRDRAWLAFRQHYAGGQQEGAEVTGVDADFARPDALIEQDFPGAASPLAAVTSNPAAIAAHVGRNLGNAPRAVVALLPFGSSPAWRWTVVSAAAAVLAASLLWRRRRWCGLLRRRRAALVAMATVAAVAVAVSMVLLPRADLLLALVPPGLAMLGLALRVWLRRSRWQLAIAAAFVGTLLLAPRAHAEPGGSPRETRAIVRLLQRHHFVAGERVAARFAEQLVLFAPVGSSVRAVDLVALRARCDNVAQASILLREAAPDLVLVSPGSLDALGPLAAALIAELSTDDWQIVDYFFPVLLYRRNA